MAISWLVVVACCAVGELVSAVDSVTIGRQWFASSIGGLSSGGVSSNSGWRVLKSLPILESWDGLSKPTGGSPSVVAFGCAVGASDVVLGPVDRLPRLVAPV